MKLFIIKDLTLNVLRFYISNLYKQIVPSYIYQMRFSFARQINNTPKRLFGVLAVLSFLLVNTADIHSHFCLDGQEPAISLHFENFSGHPDHAVDEQAHSDFENEVSLKTLKSKSTDLSTLFLTSSDNAILLEESYSSKVNFTLDELQLPVSPSGIRPPLRAPPVLVG